MIRRVNVPEIASYCRNVLGLRDDVSLKDEEFLAASIRRAAGYLCPCSRNFIAQSLEESIRHLMSTSDDIRERIDRVMESLVVTGDLLEIDDVTLSVENSRRDWLFAAPPSFVKRKSGSIYILGVVPDQDTFLPKSINELIELNGAARWIRPENSECLTETLIDQGLHQLDESVWLKRPSIMDAKEFISSRQKHFSNAPYSGEISGLKIIDNNKDVKYYRGRWQEPSDQTGDFVGRRTREFGPDSWCFVRLRYGNPEKVIELPHEPYPWRACDAAWHLQMALDYSRGTPQCYSVRKLDDQARISFFSPLPIWAKRRLSVVGTEVDAVDALNTYLLPVSELKEEEAYLAEGLWLTPSSGN